MQLSPTSYALLGLLSVQPWTTYELTRQTKRSLRFFFPRAERQLYAEAKRLTDAGLATTTVSLTGRRRTTTYAITAAGRKAMADWLRTEPAPAVLEAEVLVRTFFADSGRKQDVLAAIEAARRHAVMAQHELAEMAQALLDSRAPFPERSAVGALGMRFVVDFHRLFEQWAIWAGQEVRTWRHVDGRDWDGALGVFADVATKGGDREDQPDRPAG